jgi:hypothetical protein
VGAAWRRHTSPSRQLWMPTSRCAKPPAFGLSRDRPSFGLRIAVVLTANVASHAIGVPDVAPHPAWKLPEQPFNPIVRSPQVYQSSFRMLLGKLRLPALLAGPLLLHTASASFGCLATRPQWRASSLDAKGLHLRAPSAARRNSQHDTAAGACPLAPCLQRCTSCESGLGFRVGGRSRGRYATPADFPRHDGTPYRGLRVRRWGLGGVPRSRSTLCRAVPNP